MIGGQVFSELKDIYGREQATTIAGNCNTRLVLNTPDMETAQWLSDSLGRKEEESLQESISYGAAEIRDGVNVARREQLQPLVLPSSLMRLNPLNGFLKMPQEFPVAKVLLKPVQREVIAEAFIEDEYVDRMTGVVLEPSEPEGGDAATNSQHKKPKTKKDRNGNNKNKDKAKDKKKPATRSVSTPPDDIITQDYHSRGDDGWSGNSYPSGPAISRLSGDPRPDPSIHPIQDKYGGKKKKKKNDDGGQTSLPLEVPSLDTPLNGQRQSEFTEEKQGEIIMTNDEYGADYFNELNLKESADAKIDTRAESVETANNSEQIDLEIPDSNIKAIEGKNDMNPDTEPANFSSGKKFKSSMNELAYNMQAPTTDQNEDTPPSKDKNKNKLADKEQNEAQPPIDVENKALPPDPNPEELIRGIYKDI